MTERLYYDDAYLTRFRAKLVDIAAEGRRVYLDRTAFYPESGGQPHDLGLIAGIPVAEIVDEEDRVAHVLSAALTGQTEIDCSIDWERRFDHMQQHSGQHLLSAVLADLFGFQTLSFHLGATASTIDLAAPALTAQQITAAERRASEVVFENRGIRVSYEDAAEAAGLRKAAERAGTLRIIAIDGLDRSACGGTHVRATGEIGPILLRGTERIRGNTRLEFLCGRRAVARARADFDAISRIAQSFSCALDSAAEMVLVQQARLAEADKARRKLAAEMAFRRGAELVATAEMAGTLRVHWDEGRPALDEEARSEAQGFTSNSRTVWVSTASSPPAILLAVSVDSGINAGAVLKTALSEAGGRGGGSPQSAQGSVPDVAALERVCARLRSDLTNTAGR